MQRFAPSDKLGSRYSSKRRHRGAPPQSTPCWWCIHWMFLWTLLFIKCHLVQSSTRNGNGALLSSSTNNFAETNKQRNIQSVPAPSPIKSYTTIRINAGGESEYIDTNGISWGADEWYDDKGRRTTPSECTTAIFNTTDDILYCSNRFYPTSIVLPPYQYTIPLPYSALYDVRLHFAETVFNSTGRRVFDILVEGEVAINNLDVFARAGAVTAYVVKLQVYVSDQSVSIQFVPVVNNPFISAIEVLEIPNSTIPIAIPAASPIFTPSASPMKATYIEEVRLNAGGGTFVDSRGNTWSNDTKYVKGGNSVVSDIACTSGSDILNTIDDALFCTQRYFKGNSTLLSSYEIPVDGVAKYQLRLYFSENFFSTSGMRIFDVLVEGKVVIENFDIFESAGGPVTLFVVSIVANVTDGFFSVGFTPKVNYPTINAIEVYLLTTENVTTTMSISPSSSPTLNIDGFAVSECSVYPVCVSAGYTGNCCPDSNGTTRECCSGNLQLSLAPSHVSSDAPSDIASLSPSIVPTNGTSLAPSASLLSTGTIKPSIQRIAPTLPQDPVFEFNKTIKSVSGAIMVLSRNAQELDEALASDSNCTKIWQDAIKGRIEAEVRAVIPMYETMDVSLFDISRSSNLSSISLTFDAVVELRSAVQDVDANRFIKGPFDSQSEKVSFIQYLATTSCPEFDNIATIEIIIPSEVNAAEGGDISSDDEQFLLGLIIAVGAGSGAILLTVLFVTYVRMKQRRKIDELDRASIPPGSIKEDRIESTPLDIDRSNDGTDISTLGDPIIPGGFVKSNHVDASTVGSEEYDYNKAYLDLESVTESHTGETNTINSYQQVLTNADDLHSVNDIISTTGESAIDTLIPETEYSVTAPPGLLGLILESSIVDRTPIVNSVKPFSALVNRVRVGDRLILVDNEDVSVMTASNVSQLIASKQSETRILTFKRRLIDSSNGRKVTMNNNSSLHFFQGHVVGSLSMIIYSTD